MKATQEGMIVEALRWAEQHGSRGLAECKMVRAERYIVSKLLTPEQEKQYAVMVEALRYRLGLAKPRWIPAERRKK